MKAFEDGQKNDEETIQKSLEAQGLKLDTSDPLSIFKIILAQVKK